MSSYTQPTAARRGVPVAVASLGGLVFLATIPLGAQATLGGAIVFLLACLVAVRDTSVPVFTWVNMAAAFILLIWLVPIRTYSLPVDLPFNLEPYRLFLVVLVVAWLFGLLGGRSRLSARGQTYVLILLTAVLFATQILNFDEVDTGTAEPEALKSLSFFLSFVIVFLLVTSTINSASALDKLVQVLVAGGGIVALATLYDARFCVQRLRAYPSVDPRARVPAARGGSGAGRAHPSVRLGAASDCAERRPTDDDPARDLPGEPGEHGPPVPALAGDRDRVHHGRAGHRFEDDGRHGRGHGPGRSRASRKGARRGSGPCSSCCRS